MSLLVFEKGFGPFRYYKCVDDSLKILKIYLLGSFKVKEIERFGAEKRLLEKVNVFPFPRAIFSGSILVFGGTYENVLIQRILKLGSFELRRFFQTAGSIVRWVTTCCFKQHPNNWTQLKVKKQERKETSRKCLIFHP